jgi:phosphoribosylformimino-5-aminoimidazole carboxamide ribotide isomerase
MTRFRPCIDLHQGKVKQIVGSSLRDDGKELKTNFVSQRSAGWYGSLYASDQLHGGHVIKLGPGNDEAAREALAAYPGGLQIGGGVDLGNARHWLDAGASHVIVTSYLFSPEGVFLADRLEELAQCIGPQRLVVDLSCKAVGQGWVVAMNRWQTLTDLQITAESLQRLGHFCAELLVHAVDVEGKCEGIDEELVVFLAQHSPLPVTYAGGVASLADLRRIDELSAGRVDATVGSALDLFGGQGVSYHELVAFNRRVA